MRKFRVLFFCIALLALSAAFHLNASEDGVAVKGNVEFHEKTLTGHQKAETVEDVLVYLEADDDATRQKLAGMPVVTVWLNQKDKEFIPRVLAVQTGGSVRFGNEDPWFHNVYSNDPRFNLGRYPRGFFKEQQFDEPGLSHVFCDIHPTMHAIILVVDTPLFAHVDDDGGFELKNAPAGSYRLTAWHNRAEPVSVAVMIGEAEPEPIRLVLKASKMETASRRPGEAYDGRRSLLNR